MLGESTVNSAETHLGAGSREASAHPLTMLDPSARFLHWAGGCKENTGKSVKKCKLKQFGRVTGSLDDLHLEAERRS